jgi:hypothetical protein
MPDWLLRSILAAVFSAIIFGGAGLVTNFILNNRKWVELDETQGRTAPTGMVFFLVGLCALMSGFFLWLGLFTSSVDEPGEDLALWGLVIGFGVGSVFSIFQCLPRWSWDEGGLHYKGAFRNISILWNEIERAGLGWHGSSFARAADGRVIYWSEYVIGHAMITAALLERRPEFTRKFGYDA